MWKTEGKDGEGSWKACAWERDDGSTRPLRGPRHLCSRGGETCTLSKDSGADGGETCSVSLEDEYTCLPQLLCYTSCCGSSSLELTCPPVSLLQTSSAYCGPEAGGRDIKFRKTELDSLQEFSLQWKSVAITVQYHGRGKHGIPEA